MSVDHDPRDRVVPPRCHECNAPLCLDDADFVLHPGSSPVFCNYCLALVIFE